MSIHRGGRGIGHISRSARATASVQLSGLVVTGDSWQAPSLYSQYLDDWSAANPSIPFHRVATSGWTIADLQANVSTIASYNPALVTILIGLNDLGAYPSGTSGWMTALQNLVSSLKSAIPGVKVAVATVPAAYSTVANHNARRAVVNPQIRSGVGVWHDAVIPIGDWITDADAGDGSATTTYYLGSMSPGHPTTLLRGLLGQIFTAVLNPFFANSTATSPSAFSFNDQPGATASQSYTAFITAPLTGMKLGQAGTAVHTNSGTFQANRNLPSDTSNKTVYNGDWLGATSTASSVVSPPTAVDNTITIGTTSDTFTVTTGPVATDDFNRANGAPGSTPVGNYPWSGTAVISSSKLIFGQNIGGYAVINPGLQDVDFQFDVTIPSGGVGTPGLIIGGTKTGSGGTRSGDFTEHYTIDLAGGGCSLHTTGGATASLFGFTGLARGATYTCRVVSKVSTRTITLYVNGTAVTLTSGSNTYANDPNWIPDGTWIGAYEINQNTGNMVDNLSVSAAT